MSKIYEYYTNLTVVIDGIDFEYGAVLKFLYNHDDYISEESIVGRDIQVNMGHEFGWMELPELLINKIFNDTAIEDILIDYAKRNSGMCSTDTDNMSPAEQQAYRAGLEHALAEIDRHFHHACAEDKDRCVKCGKDIRDPIHISGHELSDASLRIKQLLEKLGD